MKKFLKWFAGIILVLFLMVVYLVGPLDRTPLKDQPFYKMMMTKLDTLKPSVYPPAHAIKVGWSNANITPSYAMPMAGYTPRPEFKSVHDSLYARILAIDNGSLTSYLISTDLMLFPPALKARINDKLEAAGMKNYFLYLSSTHTHNGVGGWNDSLLGNLVLGTYHEEWVEWAAQTIVNKMMEANASKINSTLSYFESDVSEWVENRIAFDQGTIDGKLRGISVNRQDGTKGILFTFGAHATSISKKLLELSGDYPAETIKRLKTKGWNFGMYMAGMVGSHRFKWMPENDFDEVSRAADILVSKMDSLSFIPAGDSLTIKATHVPIEFGPSQLRIDKNWKARDWAFRALADPLKGELTFLEIGDFIFVGTPCDFSGEIFTNEKLNELVPEKHLMITSFNGDYAGYITYDKHYEVLSKDEVMTMNWVGPYYGTYFTDMITSLLAKR